MTTKNWDRVNDGLEILLPVLLVYEITELNSAYPKSAGQNWWTDGIEPILSYEQERDFQGIYTDKDRLNNIDMALALQIIDRRWNEVFRRRLPRDCRTWVHELMTVRNDEAHRGIGDCSDDDAYRALDTMQRLCKVIEPELSDEDRKNGRIRNADKIRELMNEVRYGNAEGSAAAEAQGAGVKARKDATSTLGVADLPSWREVVEPHPDVAAGRYRNAEFAADLSQVANGTAEPEYQDPYEFFSRTYMTAGMKGLLVQSLERVGGRGGEPVIQLKTAFGGGKTHSMLALYHMFKSQVDVERASVLKEVLDDAGLSEVPKVHVAVIVGTYENPAKSERPANLPGNTVNTLWGKIAYELATSTGRPELYDIVKEADKKHVSPGSAALTQLFDECGSCLVLIDELVAYAKKLYGVEGLPAGTFDNLITFIQELTEAARASKSSLVVASIPESEREIGGDAGRTALEAIEHTFGRMESVWKPVTSDEGFSVVSRRLFSSRVDEEKCEQVCQAYARMYRENPDDFPIETREASYLDRLRDCYPVHPEVYDRLYEDWATIDGFQRTRGVLRFMAAVIHELWAEGDSMPLINVGSLPFDEPPVRDELTRYLPETWNGVVEAEVDGDKSEPYSQDGEKSRYGQVFASRRVSRAVFMGSAPDMSQRTARGIDMRQVNLGVISPQESVSVFRDALMDLRKRCSYLYADSQNERFWFDTRPNLRKTVEGRAQGIADDQVDAELEGLLRKWGKAKPLVGVHACPTSSLDVPDECGARLVILGLDAWHKKDEDDTPALQTARDYLANRGNGPRKYRNALIFLVPDGDRVYELRNEAKLLLAWRSVLADAGPAQLDLAQSALQEVKDNIESEMQTVESKLEGAYQWVLYPTVDPAFGGMATEWQAVRVGPSGGTVVERCVGTLRGEGALVDTWSPMMLKMELDRWLWRDRDCIEARELWDMLNRYCYLERVADRSVLDDAICEGSGSSEYFGIAAGVEGEGDERRFVDLRLGERCSRVYDGDLLVKVDAARVQLEAEKAARRAEEERRAAAAGAGGVATSGAGGGYAGGDDFGAALDGGYDSWSQAGGARGTPASAAVAGDGYANGGTVGAGEPRRDPVTFHLSTKVDSVHINKVAGAIGEEIIQNLEHVPGAEVTVRIEVTAHVDDGFDASVQRTVGENCHTLGIDEYGFNE